MLDCLASPYHYLSQMHPVQCLGRCRDAVHAGLDRIKPIFDLGMGTLLVWGLKPELFTLAGFIGMMRFSTADRVGEEAHAFWNRHWVVLSLATAPLYLTASDALVALTVTCAATLCALRVGRLLSDWTAKSK